ILVLVSGSFSTAKKSANPNGPRECRSSRAVERGTVQCWARGSPAEYLPGTCRSTEVDARVPGGISEWPIQLPTEPTGIYDLRGHRQRPGERRPGHLGCAGRCVLRTRSPVEPAASAIP